MEIIDKPNSNHKARESSADGIIIHSMGEYVNDEHASDFLQNIGLSAHFLITPLGEIVQTVSCDDVAYHAGKSRLGEQENLNSTFIGIEILVEGKHDYTSFVEAIKEADTFKEIQYTNCALLCRSLMEDYPSITLGRIVRHSEVSGDNVRGEGKGKVDPGKGFDMAKLKVQILSDEAD